MATLALPTTALPGPRSLPYLGGRINMVRLFLSPFTTLRRLHDTYGNLAALAHGDPSYVAAFGPELNHQILAHPEIFANGAEALLRLPEDSAMKRLFANNLSTMNGAHHKQQRKLLQPAFHKRQISLYRDDMVALTQMMLDRWQGQPNCDLLREMKQLTQRIAVKTLFGVLNEAELDRIGTLLRETLTTSSSLAMLVAPFNIPGTPYNRALRMAEQMEAYIRSLIVQKRAQPDATDVLATLAHVRDEDGSRLSDDEMIGHAFAIFVAGHETTSNALTWTVFLLNQHPEIMADLLDELDGTLGGAAPTLEQLRPDAAELPLLDGVIKESMRLLPPAIVGLRVTAAPCELGGYALPKNANIVYSEFITHRLPELYDEPDRFKPQRWATLDRSLYQYLPFSAGPHMCIGAGFAIQELKVVLAMLLQRYRLSVVPNTKIDVNVRMHPTHGMPVRIYPQDRQFERVPVRGMIEQLVTFPA